MAGLNLLVTGKPGVGKTTLVERVVDEFRGRLRLAGFTTGEIRDRSGARVGFEVATVEGQRGELARVGLRSPHRVGRYGVNVQEFESLVLPMLARRDVELMVIDEIGKMECASARFRGAVEDVLDARIKVLATLGVGRLPFFQAIRDRPDVELVALTERNRGALVGKLCLRLQAA